MSQASNITPNDYVRLKASFKDMSEISTKIELFQVSLREAKKGLADVFKDLLSSAEINTLFKLYHKETAEEYFETQSDLEEVFHKIDQAKGE